jgi:hypothetical protein
LFSSEKSLGETILEKMIAEVGQQLADRVVDGARWLSEMRTRDGCSSSDQTEFSK